MKPRKAKYNQLVIPVFGTVGSTLGLVMFLWLRIGTGADFFLGLLTALFIGTVGIFARKVARQIRQLERSPRVFVSSSSRDGAFAQMVAKSLREEGARVWLTEQGILTGESVEESMKKGLEEADVFVILVSGELSPNILMEISLAQAKGVRIVPVVLGDARIPSELASLPYLNTSADRKEDIRRVIEAVT